MTRLYVWVSEWLRVGEALVSICTGCSVRPAWSFRWFDWWMLRTLDRARSAQGR